MEYHIVWYTMHFLGEHKKFGYEVGVLKPQPYYISYQYHIISSCYVPKILFLKFILSSCTHVTNPSVIFAGKPFILQPHYASTIILKVDPFL